MIIKKVIIGSKLCFTISILKFFYESSFILLRLFYFIFLVIENVWIFLYVIILYTNSYVNISIKYLGKYPYLFTLPKENICFSFYLFFSLSLTLYTCNIYSYINIWRVCIKGNWNVISFISLQIKVVLKGLTNKVCALNS